MASRVDSSPARQGIGLAELCHGSAVSRHTAIDLIVRGMCSLQPGLQGVSERIRVISIVDRYLEHARIFYFHNGGNPNYWLASADWMPRNFNRRIEIAFPVMEPHLQSKLKDILELQLADTVKGWWMEAGGSYTRSRRKNKNAPLCGFRSTFMKSCKLGTSLHLFCRPPGMIVEQSVVRARLYLGDMKLGGFVLETRNKRL